jgi:hypothetical protein
VRKPLDLLVRVCSRGDAPCYIDVLGELRVNRGAQRAIGSGVTTRGSEASAESRCLIVDT